MRLENQGPKTKTQNPRKARKPRVRGFACVSSWVCKSLVLAWVACFELIPFQITPATM